MRLIDADALHERLFSYYSCVNPDATKGNYKGETLMDYEIVDMIQDCLENAPTVTPESLVRHRVPSYHNRPAHYEVYEMVEQAKNGEPLYKRRNYTLQDNLVAYCPECGKRLCSRFMNYCPNCGCKMDLEE